MINLTNVYIITALLWGIYAGRQQLRYYPWSSRLRVILAVAANILLAPLCILLEIVSPMKHDK